MKIFNKQQIYRADKLTIERQAISSDMLMERAAVKVYNWLIQRLQGDKLSVHIFCGVGNNGGDGLVIGRHLIESGYNVKIYIVNFSENRSDDFLKNLERIRALKCWPEFLTRESDFPEIVSGSLIIDAIFGIGLSRPPVDWVGKMISEINALNVFTLSVDIPSGLYLDAVPENPDHIIKADHTLTFQLPKLIFFLPQTGIYSRSWEVLDIGLDMEFINAEDVSSELIGKAEALRFYKPRSRFSHKGTYGHGLIIGGSYGKIGAVLMASESCLNSGAGLVTAFIPRCGYQILQTAFPEAMVLTDAKEEWLTNIDFEFRPSAVGIGVGMGINSETVQAFISFLRRYDGPLVIDADGINILAAYPDIIESVPQNTVLTPHPRELQRLIGDWKDDFEKLEMAKAFSEKYNVVMVLKDAYTITVYKDKYFVNNTGNPGMATGGSGDVLTGMITGLMAQGYDSLTAAVFGVYLHGRSADLAVAKTSYQALTATDIIDFTGDAFLDLFEEGEGSMDHN